MVKWVSFSLYMQFKHNTCILFLKKGCVSRNFLSNKIQVCHLFSDSELRILLQISSLMPGFTTHGILPDCELGLFCSSIFFCSWLCLFVLYCIVLQSSIFQNFGFVSLFSLLYFKILNNLKSNPITFSTLISFSVFHPFPTLVLACI